MADSLSEQMLEAYDRSASRADRFRKLHGSDDVFTNVDQFELEVRRRFLLGVHHAFSKEIIAWMTRNVGAQQRIADALGLKDRTSISKMLRSGTMDGVRVTAALYQFGHIITLPTRERAALHGFSHATSFIKAQVLHDDSIEGSMTPQEFSDLVGMLADEEWDDAIRDPNPATAREVAVRIIDEREIPADGPQTRRSKRLRPEQCVMMLKDVHETWGDYGAVALCSIPDCIPTVESSREATL